MSTLSGFHYFLRGFQLIAQPGIKRFVIIPALLGMLLFVGLFFIARHFVGEANHWLVHWLPSWLHWLRIIVWILFVISFSIAFIYTYTTLANLVSAPFNGLLAEKVAELITGNPPLDTNWGALIKDVPRICGRQLSIIGYYLPRAIAIGILFFIPLIQIIAAPLWLVFHAWFMALQYVDYPTDNARIPLRQVRTQLAQKRWLNLTFGGSVLAGSMIPLLNLLVMPAAIAGATELWVREYGVKS